MSPRCTIVRLDIRDLARAVEDPKLSALLAEGWRPIAHLAVAEDDGAPGLVLLLAPPLSVLAPSRESTPIPPAVSPWQLGVIVGATPMFLAILFVALWAAFR